MKALLALLVLSLPALAHADDFTSCESRSKRTKIVVNEIKEVGRENDAMETPVDATITIVRLNGRPANYVQRLVGIKAMSAKGEYYDLAWKSEASLLIAAAASHSPSELKIGKRTFLVDCD